MTINTKEKPLMAVDDDIAYLYLLKTTHKNLKLNSPLILCKSGEECLEYLKSTVGFKLKFPSTILMDVNMPAMNGFETLRNIRKQEQFQSTPFVFMLSSSSDFRDKKYSIEVGANGYLNKYDCALDNIVRGGPYYLNSNRMT